MYNSGLNERGGLGWVGWLIRTLLPPNQGKISVRFEWKNGKNLRIIMLLLPMLVLLVFFWFFVCLSSVISTIGRIKEYITHYSIQNFSEIINKLIIIASLPI